MAPPSCTGRFGWSKPGTATHVILIALIHRITDASRVDRMTIWRKLIFADKCHHAIKRVADNLGFRNPVAPDELKIHLIISHETTDSPTIFFYRPTVYRYLSLATFIQRPKNRSRGLAAK